jgi:hypothetical protein
MAMVFQGEVYVALKDAKDEIIELKNTLKVQEQFDRIRALVTYTHIHIHVHTHTHTHTHTYTHTCTHAYAHICINKYTHT